MREKLKQLREKEEGFTLVELLAVIVILGIILAIAIPAVGNIISKAEGDATEAEHAMIVDAGRLYLTAEDKGSSVSVKTLIDENYIEERDGDSISKIGSYTVEKDGKTYKLMNGQEVVYPKNSTTTE